MRPSTILLAAIAAGSVSAARCDAQGQLSEKALVAQTVAGTTVTVEYYRPVARGRQALFGKEVTWGEYWTPGANWATTIDVDHDLSVEGQTLPKGKYSLWIRVREHEPWMIDFHKRAKLFHTNRPDSTDLQLSLTAKPDSGPRTEVLTFDFPDVDGSRSVLRLRWENVVLALHIAAIAPHLVTAMPDSLRARYLGQYDVEVLASTTGGKPFHRRIELVTAGDALHWRDIDPMQGEKREFVLLPDAENEFTRAKRAADGQYWMDQGAVVVFTVANGRATGFEVQFDGNAVSRAKRMP